MRAPSIPDDVLAKITKHRPHLEPMVSNLRTHPEMAQALEKRIADAYLRGETKLSASETWKLAACGAGRPYGG